MHDDGWLAQGAVDNAHIAELADALRPWAYCKRAAISNVAGAAVAGRLEKSWALGITPLRFTAQCRRLRREEIGYADPQQLGSDRWAALVAAWAALSGTVRCGRGGDGVDSGCLVR